MVTAIILLLFVAWFADLGGSINVTRVIAPKWVEIGGDAALECQYRLEGETLYSIKWYQGLSEIYRYTPSKSRTVQVFHNNFLDVDVERSSAGLVHVSNVSVEADGPFRCEVSGEAPEFFTDYGAVQLRVVAVPEGGPELLGVEPLYKSNDWVSITCTIRRARPAPTLTFFINGQQPRPGWVEQQTTSLLPGGLSSTSVRIHFYLRRHLLQPPDREQARIRCEAIVPHLYETATEKLLNTRQHLLRASVLEGRTAGGSSAAPLYHSYVTALLTVLLCSVLLSSVAATTTR